MFDESDEDVDDDGNPLTVAAAQRIHHQDGTKKMYFPKQTYSSPIDSFNQLNSKKAQISDIIQKARLGQLQQVGNSIGNAVKSDLKIHNMPVVRVLPRVTKNE
jgi:hypothetical protein